jgi:hypothetical protein
VGVVSQGVPPSRGPDRAEICAAERWWRSSAGHPRRVACTGRALGKQGDPRLHPDYTPDLTSEQRRQAHANSPVVKAAQRQLDLDAFEANRPARVPCWYFGGNTWPEHGADWPEWGQVSAYLVAPDDSVTPDMG